MNAEISQIRNTRPTLDPVSPKQTRSQMVGVNFRVPEDIKDAAFERCREEDVNLTDVLRKFLTAWARREDDPADE